MVLLAENATIILARQNRFQRGGSHCSRQRDFMLGLLPHFTPFLDIFSPLAKDLPDQRRSKQEIHSELSKM